MLNRVFSAVIFVFLLANLLTLAFNIQPVKASGTIYIRSDGSINPPEAPISTFDNVTYTLTGNITSDADGIVVESARAILSQLPPINTRDITLFSSYSYPRA